MMGTMFVWIATKDPPSIPAKSRQRGIAPLRAALRKVRIPLLIRGENIATTLMMRSPEENEMRAA